jgi:outer membrane biosynthesis protein TonB
VFRSELLKTIVGWTMSVALHMGIVAAAWYGLPYLTRPQLTPPPPIPIEFVAIAAKTQQVAPEETVEQEASVEKEQPKFQAAEQPAPAEEEAVPLPAPPEPKKTTPAPKPKPQLSKARQLAQSVRPQNKPRPPSRINSTRLSSLIDRSIKEEQEKAKLDKEKREEKKKNEAEKKQKSMFAAARGAIATATIRDALAQKLSGCWSFPSGAKDVDQMQVRVLIYLRPDGTLLRQPDVQGAGRNAEGFYRVFVESARRAVIGCAPYSDVAKTLFEMGESSIDFNFNGAEFGG